MSSQSVLALGLLLAGLASLVRADQPKQQDLQRLREENLKLREGLLEREKRLLEMERRLLESEKKALEAAKEAYKQRDQAKEELKAVVQKLQQQQLELLAQKNEDRKARIQAEVEAKTFQARSIELEAKVRELTRELAILKATIPGTAPKKPDPDNPPPDNLQGKVLRVQEKEGLLVVSIGSDAGLKPGHTLKLFRLSDVSEEAKYLGVVEVLKVTPQEAVARVRGKSLVPIKPGDKVASRVSGAE